MRMHAMQISHETILFYDRDRAKTVAPFSLSAVYNRDEFLCYVIPMLALLASIIVQDKTKKRTSK